MLIPTSVFLILFPVHCFRHWGVSLNVVHAGLSLATWTVDFISVDATNYSPSVGYISHWNIQVLSHPMVQSSVYTLRGSQDRAFLLLNMRMKYLLCGNRKNSLKGISLWTSSTASSVKGWYTMIFFQISSLMVHTHENKTYSEWQLFEFCLAALYII